jgi:hypothetical protein
MAAHTGKQLLTNVRKYPILRMEISIRVNVQGGK